MLSMMRSAKGPSLTMIPPKLRMRSCCKGARFRQYVEKKKAPFFSWSLQGHTSCGIYLMIGVERARRDEVFEDGIRVHPKPISNRPNFFCRSREQNSNLFRKRIHVLMSGTFLSRGMMGGLCHLNDISALPGLNVPSVSMTMTFPAPPPKSGGSCATKTRVRIIFRNLHKH
jgi:hypothetical protein